MTKISTKYSRDDWERSKTLLSEDLLLSIIESEDVNVEVEKET